MVNSRKEEVLVLVRCERRIEVRAVTGSLAFYHRSPNLRVSMSLTSVLIGITYGNWKDYGFDTSQ